ncbi:hypothetical protein J8J14_12590 [Roseomonas sp. SSH11]|uniref:Uncharacterized protein n=1 Tax=Pararoseomonas baculiformis TaxID=2820812 RepID=A0ABS4AHC4_9PROT|nr:hypothetical protein [Pararoseomonas baculiformis]MBP0445614.1 hypothetical protein [Pararoseomonas baculiformis]
MASFPRFSYWCASARRRPVLLLLAVLLAPLPGHAAAPLTEETAAAMGSFMQICARVLTGGDSAAAARQAGFTALPAERAAALLGRAQGQVMAARGQSTGGLVLILTTRPLACSMRLQRMDVETAEALFVRLAEGVRRPGLTVTRAFDGQVPVPGAGMARQITYRLSSGQEGRPDFALAFTGDADPGAGTQGVLTFGTTAPRR